MNELDSIRMKKLAEMQSNAAMQSSQVQRQAQEQAEFQQKFSELEGIIKQIFTKDALERYGNIKAVDPDKAVQIITIVGQLVQAGKVDIVNDEMLRNLLGRLTPQKKEFSIKRV